jgi:hypothetical protein
MITVRCSSLDELFACPPSVTNPQQLVKIKPLHEASVRGRIVHSLVAKYAEHGEYDLYADCTREGWVDTEEIADLMGYAVRAWDELKKYFPNPQFEVCVTGKSGDILETTGTIDVVSPLEGNAAIFADYKSGYADEGYHNQMFGYAHALWCELGKPQDLQITGVVIFLRHRYYRIVRYNAQNLQEWEFNLTHNVLGNASTYRPGKQCRYCTLYHSCPARREIVSGMIDALIRGKLLPDDDPFKQYIEKAKELLPTLTAETKADPYVASAFNDLIYICKLIEQQVQDVRAMMRNAVETAGPIPLSADTELALREVEIRQLDPEKAIPVLRRELADAQVCRCMKLSLPKVLVTYSGMFGKGEKGKAARHLENLLRQSGAVQVTVQQRLEEIDVTPPTEANSNDTDASTGEQDQPAAGDGAIAPTSGS